MFLFCNWKGYFFQTDWESTINYEVHMISVRHDFCLTFSFLKQRDQDAIWTLLLLGIEHNSHWSYVYAMTYQDHVYNAVGLFTHPFIGLWATWVLVISFWYIHVLGTCFTEHVCISLDKNFQIISELLTFRCDLDIVTLDEPQTHFAVARNQMLWDLDLLPWNLRKLSWPIFSINLRSGVKIWWFSKMLQMVKPKPR